jgi:hypothetical protein
MCNHKLTTFELHGFFLCNTFFEDLVHALAQCKKLTRLSLSSNNIADEGVEVICKHFASDEDDSDDEYKERDSCDYPKL